MSIPFLAFLSPNTNIIASDFSSPYLNNHNYECDTQSCKRPCNDQWQLPKNKNRRTQVNIRAPLLLQQPSTAAVSHQTQKTNLKSTVDTCTINLSFVFQELTQYRPFFLQTKSMSSPPAKSFALLIMSDKARQALLLHRYQRWIARVRFKQKTITRINKFQNQGCNLTKPRVR